MIQIEDWVLFLGIIIFFFAGLIYLIYFIITKKFFPMDVEFQGEINPNKSRTLCSIDGYGIIKKVEMIVAENESSLISMIIDGGSYANFLISGGSNNLAIINSSSQENKQLSFEVNLNTKFYKNFSLSIHNRGNSVTINSKGKILYEIKKPLKAVLKALYKEMTS